jgi:hypothetical protein
MNRRLAVSALAFALVAGCGSGSSKAASNPTTTRTEAPTEPSTAPTTAASPAALEPCVLVTRDDAQKVIGMPLAAGVVDGPKGDEGCTYTADPNGPVGQVEIYAGPGGKSYYDIDKGKTVADRGIGDEAHYEDYTIFFRKGQNWVAIALTTLSDPAGFKTGLEALAKKVVAEMP